MTLAGDLSLSVRDRIERQEFTDDLFTPVYSEVLLMLSTNGLHDFLRVLEAAVLSALERSQSLVQQWSAPSLSECFSDPANYERFLAFARKDGHDNRVMLVQVRRHLARAFVLSPLTHARGPSNRKFCLSRLRVAKASNPLNKARRLPTRSLPLPSKCAPLKQWPPRKLL